MRLVLLVSAAGLLILGLLGALGFGIWASLTPGQQDVVGDILAQQAGLLVGCALLFVTLLAIGLAVFLGRYAGAAKRLAAETELIASVNPDHQVRPEGAAEMRSLAEAVNRLGDRYGALRLDVEDTARRARADVEEERDRLAALMAEMTQAILVCNVDGRILLYNTAAQDLLGAGTAGGFVGLGRSLFGIVDRDVVLHGLSYVRGLAERGDERPVARFATEVGGRLVRSHLAPVQGREAQLTGFILTLEDVTTQAAAVDRRSALLRGLFDGTRRAVANIRAAVEALQDWGEVDREQQERFLGIVRDEARTLGSRVEETAEESGDLAAGHWALEEMRGRDLLALIRRALEHTPETLVRVEDADAAVWLRVDAYSLTQMVGCIAERLGSEPGIGEIALSLHGDGAQASLDVRWSGPALDAETLGAWEQEALVKDGRALPYSLRDVLDRHGAEAWSQRDGDAALLRFLLPSAPQPAREALLPAPHARLEPGGRPEFYDFDLFARIEPEAEAEERALAELAYTVFDTETTGLDPAGGDEIIAIGAVRIVNGRILSAEAFDHLIDPGRPVSEASRRIHGISAEMLAGRPRIAEVLPRFARFAEETVLVGHNVAFDMRFLAEKEAATGVRLVQPVLDTLLLSAVAHPDHQDHSLEAMAERLGVSVIGRHTALGDALLTAEVFLRLARVLGERGVLTLGDALAAARRTYQARVSDSLYSG
jgi:DNA polymerase III subunit epsilon